MSLLPESAVTDAIERNLFGLFLLFRGWRRAHVHDDPSILWTVTDIPYPLFNSVMRARLSAADADCAIDSAIARGIAGSVPLLWWTGPGTLPRDLAVRLGARGFTKEADMPGMAASVDAVTDWPTPPGLVMTEARGLKEFQAWARTMATGFGFPMFVAEAFEDLHASLDSHDLSRLAFLLGRLDGVPVGTSMLFLTPGAAGVHYVATVPDARGRGVGAAMTLAAVEKARVARCRIAVLEASEMGEPLYRKLGFRAYCRIGQHLWQAVAAT